MKGSLNISSVEVGLQSSAGNAREDVGFSGGGS